jgi:hypothetical protein
MSRPESGTRTVVLDDEAAGRRWFISPLGRFALTIGASGTGAVTIADAAPVLLVKPRSDFVWPSELDIDDVENAVTAVDVGRRRGSTQAWTWRISRRLGSTMAFPQPAGGALVSTHPVSAVRSSREATMDPEGSVATSCDGRYVAAFAYEDEPGIMVTDTTTGRTGFMVAGWYSRRWLVDGPMWSEDGSWLLCAWYTTKHWDHGWISGISRDDLKRQLALTDNSKLEWTMTGFPNGGPADDEEEQAGSCEEIKLSWLASDCSAVYCLDPQTISGFSFPHMVPLFRLQRPELATVRHSVPIPTASLPHLAWAADGQLAIATEEGRVGGIWVELGGMWTPEVSLVGPILGFDARGHERIAIDAISRLLWWDAGTNPVEIADLSGLVAPSACSVRLVGPGRALVGGVEGQLLTLDREGGIHPMAATSLGDVAQIYLSADAAHAAVHALDGRYVTFDMCMTAPRARMSGLAERLTLGRDGMPVVVDSADFVHPNSDEKRRVYSAGGFGDPVAPDIAVVYMDEIVATALSEPQVLDIAYRDTGSEGIAVALRSGIISLLDIGTGDVTVTTLGGAEAERITFDPSGSVLAAASTGAVHLLFPLS